MSVPLYQDSIASELAFVLGHAEVSVVVAEDQEQVDKVLSIAGELPSLRLVVYDDPRGMGAYEHSILKSFSELEEMGATFAKDHPDYFEREVDQGAAADIAAIAYTSGTTGRSKGALLSHGNMIATSEIFQAVEPLRRGDNWLCYLPMGWVGDMTYSLGTSMVAGATCNCPESPETVQRDLRELGPTIFLAPPRIWESMLTGLQVRAADASWLKRRCLVFPRACRAMQLLATDGKPIPATTRLGYRLAGLRLRPVRDQLGLAQCAGARSAAPRSEPTRFVSSARSASPEQVYGAAGVRPRPCRATTRPTSAVGRTFPRRQGEGEAGGKGLACSSATKKTKHARAITQDGWPRTGDAGPWTRPALAIIDRP
jgi:long-chain acyl-CoA synthetase